MKYTQLVKTIDSTSQHLLGRAATAVHQALVIRNWLIGAYIVEFEQNGEDRAKYGGKLIERLCADLSNRGLPGLSLSMLERTRRLYQCYPQIGLAIPSSLMTESCNNMIEPISSPVVRESADVITPLSPNAVLHFSWTQLIDLIRDPYVLEFTGLAEQPEYTENELESALLDHLQKFLLELGVGFCFEARQFRVTLGNKHDYVDLVFYHRHLRCHVILDLKVRPFNHGDAGHMNFYLNYFKDRLAGPGDQPPVGIILCSDRDGAEVEYATTGISNKLFVSRYLTALPSVEQLKRFVETDRARTEALIEQQKRLRHPKSSARKAARRQKY